MIEVICADVVKWAEEYEGPPFHALLCDAPWEYKFMGKSWDASGITFQPETWKALAEHLLPGAFLMVFAGSRGWHRLACALEDAGLILQPSIFVWGTGMLEVPLCLGWLTGQAFPKATRLFKEQKIWRRRQYRWLAWLGRIGNWLLKKRGRSPRYYLDFTWQDHRYGGQILKDALTPIIVAQKPWEGKRLDCITETGAGAINIDNARVGINESDRRDMEERSGRPTQSTVCVGGWLDNRGERFWEPAQGRWPSNFCLVHAPGCRRVGVRRVKPLEGHRPNPVGKQADGQIQFNEKMPGYQKTSYTGTDGMEAVADWECVAGCVCAKLGEQSGENKSSGGSGQATLEARERHFKVSKGNYNDVAGLGGYGDKGTAARYFYQAGWEYECAEGCAVARLDEQAGERPGGRPITNPSAESTNAIYRKYPHGRSTVGSGRQDSGGPSRFYHNADWSHEIAEQLAQSDPVRYQSKAAKKERNNGLADFYWRKDKTAPIGFVRISKDEWEELGCEEERIKQETGKRVRLRAQGNIHPTQKPIALTKWLATLLLPPKEYAPRRILIPFAGKGSEAIGALLAGWEEAVAIELYQDYCDAMAARVDFWLDGRQLELL